MFRPNATPAKVAGRQTLGEWCASRMDEYTKGGKFRAMIEDVCDFCKSVIWVNRDQMKFLKYGCKFCCSNCWLEKGFKFGQKGVTKVFFKHELVSMWNKGKHIAGNSKG